jgi:pyridoxine 5-phosphate synthase
MVTLVPEKREERTTEGGLDVAGQQDALTRYTARLLDAGILVSMFIDPDERQVDASRATGATIIELHTGDYAEAAGTHAAYELDRLSQATRYGKASGLTVAAGHGLDYHNLAPLVTQIPDIVEYNIGHSIVARAVFSGFEQAVRDMVALIRDASLARRR